MGLAFVDGCVADAVRSDVFGAWAVESVVCELFDDVPAPAGDSAHGEHGCEEVELEADAVVCGCAVEIDVGVDSFCGDGCFHDLLDAVAFGVEVLIAGVFCELFCECFEVCGAWVVGLVDAVAEAHDFVFAVEFVVDVGVDVVD